MGAKKFVGRTGRAFDRVVVIEHDEPPPGGVICGRNFSIAKRIRS